MGNLPPAVNDPPTRGPTLDEKGGFAPPWRHWFELAMKRMGGPTGAPIIGDVSVFETAVNQSALAASGLVALLTAKTGEQWKIRDIRLSGGGTNFSGGDRLLSITDGTTTWSIIPAATLQTLAAAAWGDTGLPYPATAADLTVASVLSTNISAQYSGGATDYTAGECTLILTLERIA
jgi:hypothetical protein